MLTHLHERLCNLASLSVYRAKPANTTDLNIRSLCRRQSSPKLVSTFSSLLSLVIRLSNMQTLSHVPVYL